MTLIKMDALPRKHTRYCPHCDEDLTYLVYKKHKEEFMILSKEFGGVKLILKN